MDCPLVAKSLEEAKTNGLAQFLITSETEKAKESNSKRKITTLAWSTYAKMTDTTKQEALYMFGKSPEGVDPEVIDNELGLIVEKDPKRFLNVVGDDNFKDKVWLIKMVREGIVKKNGIGTGFNMTMMFGDTILGNGLEESIAYIKDKENQGIYIGLKKAYEAALKAK